MLKVFSDIKNKKLSAVEQYIDANENPSVVCGIFVGKSKRVIPNCTLLEALLTDVKMEELAKKLLLSGADPTQNNFRALYFALDNKCSSFINAIFSSPTDYMLPRAITFDLLLHAIEKNDLISCKLIMNKLNPFVDEGGRAVKAAAEFGSVPMLELLYAAGADLKVDENEPLRLCARENHLDALNFLLGNGADARARDDYALRIAAAHGHTDMVRRLLEVGCDPTADDSQALHEAIRRGFHQVETILLEEIIKRNEKVFFNNEQSSHTASVHESVSESAIRLSQRYRKIIKVDALGGIDLLKEIEKFLKNHALSFKEQAALRGFNRLVGEDYNYTDPVSNVSTKYLIVYAWLAIHDNERRIGDKIDAVAMFVEGLYEIQRGYNIDKYGRDVNDIIDKPICSAGTFNKIVEKLVSISPDVHIDFVSKSLASLKLMIVGAEEAERYICDTLKYASEQQQKDLFEKLEENGIAEIWNHIQQPIANRIFSEFGSVFLVRDASFEEFIESAQYISLDLDKIHNSLNIQKAASNPEEPNEDNNFKRNPDDPESPLYQADLDSKGNPRARSSGSAMSAGSSGSAESTTTNSSTTIDNYANMSGSSSGAASLNKKKFLTTSTATTGGKTKEPAKQSIEQSGKSYFFKDESRVKGLKAEAPERPVSSGRSKRSKRDR